MKQVWINSELHNEFKEQIAEVLGMNDFNVELFGVGSRDTTLPQNYSIVDYGSRDTLAIVKDGEPLSHDEMEKEDNINTLMCNTEYSYEAIKSVYYDKQIQEALETYEWDLIIERLDELMRDVPSEQVRIKSKYFNMKMICNVAGVSYDTYKAWTNGRIKNLNTKKLERLLNAMKEVAK